MGAGATGRGATAARASSFGSFAVGVVADSPRARFKRRVIKPALRDAGPTGDIANALNCTADSAASLFCSGGAVRVGSATVGKGRLRKPARRVVRGKGPARKASKNAAMSGSESASCDTSEQRVASARARTRRKKRSTATTACSASSWKSASFRPVASAVAASRTAKSPYSASGSSCSSTPTENVACKCFVAKSSASGLTSPRLKS